MRDMWYLHQGFWMENWIFGWDVQYLHQGTINPYCVFWVVYAIPMSKFYSYFLKKNVNMMNLLWFWNTTLDKIGTATLGRMDYLDVQMLKCVATPLWEKCEVAIHTPKNGTWESFGTPKNSEFDCRGQNTLPWGVLYTVGKVLKCRCPKWPCMSHLNICSTSYGRKKGRESNWQFDSRPLKVGNRPEPGVCRWTSTHRWKDLKDSYKFSSDLIPIGGLGKELWAAKVQGVQIGIVSGQFRDSQLGVPGQKAIWMWPPWSGVEYTIWGKVVASAKSGPWWVKWVQSCPWLVLAPRVLQNVN